MIQKKLASLFSTCENKKTKKTLTPQNRKLKRSSKMKIKHNVFEKINRQLVPDEQVLICKAALFSAISTGCAINIWMKGYTIKCARHNKERMTCDIFYNDNMAVRLKIGESGENIFCHTHIYCVFDKEWSSRMYAFETSLCLAWLELRNWEIRYESNQN
jgi:hypothetical protein